MLIRERKRGLEMMVNRTPQQEAEENAILEQAAQIQAARKAEQAQLQAQRKAANPAQPGTCYLRMLNQSNTMAALRSFCMLSRSK